MTATGFSRSQIRILWNNWARTIFGAPGTLLAQNTALSREQLATQAWRSHHGIPQPNCSKGWYSFAKILKSFKIGKNAFTKRFFSAILLKSPDLDEMAPMALFEVVDFASTVKIDLELFLDNQGIIFAQRLGLSWEWFAVQARWLYHHVSGQILLRDGAFLQKFFIRLKWAKLPLPLLGADLDEMMSRQVFKIALIKPVAVIELKPFLGALGPVLIKN